MRSAISSLSIVQYSQTPLNPHPFGGLLGYWLEELRLKKRFLEVWVKRGLTVEAHATHFPYYVSHVPCLRLTSYDGVQL